VSRPLPHFRTARRLIGQRISLPTNTRSVEATLDSILAVSRVRPAVVPAFQARLACTVVLCVTAARELRRWAACAELSTFASDERVAYLQ